MDTNIMMSLKKCSAICVVYAIASVLLPAHFRLDNESGAFCTL